MDVVNAASSAVASHAAKAASQVDEFDADIDTDVVDVDVVS